MNKKVIILVLFIFLLCGCSIEVNLTVDENNIFEEISILDYTNEQISKENILTKYRKYYPVYTDDLDEEEPDEKYSGIDYYNREVLELDNGYNIKYSYKHKLSKYYNANTLKLGFKSNNIIVDEKEKTITLATESSGINFFYIYPDLDTITINIKSDLEVVDTNGQKDGNVYKWTFTKDTEQGLYIVYKLPKKENTPKQEEPIKEENKDKEKENAFTKWVNEHPFLTAIIAIVIFIIGIKIISKININNS